MDSVNVMKAVRAHAGVTQYELAERIGTTQSAIARMERRGADVRLSSLMKALDATGLTLKLEPANPPVDLAQIDRHLSMTPSQRLAGHDAARRNTDEFLRLVRRDTS